jgi:hypothetical protein
VAKNLHRAQSLALLVRLARTPFQEEHRALIRAQLGNSPAQVQQHAGRVLLARFQQLQDRLPAKTVHLESTVLLAYPYALRVRLDHSRRHQAPQHALNA